MNEEDRIKRAFAGTGWNVRWNDGWFWDIVKHYKTRDDYKSIVLESPDGKVLVNAGTTWPAMADYYGRDYVFASAGADMSGVMRPHGKTWINVVGYLVGHGVLALAAPKWYSGGDACFVSSVEEFALKLAAFGWSETAL